MDESDIVTGIITELSPQVRDANRFNLSIDGAFVMGLDKRVVVDYGLHVGMSVNEELYQYLVQAEEKFRCRSAGMNLLAQRPRSISELRTRLRRKDFSDSAIDDAISWYREMGYVDDHEFARMWVRNRIDHRPRGKRALKSELRQKGIDSATAERVIEEAELDETGDAVKLARDRLRRLQGLEPAVKRRRLVSFLERRGFAWDAIRVVLETVLDGDDDSESD